ncbi:DUF222 domain-containing protein [Marmoricola sp. RAF53]|uniref:HNH endonuclease signature motif containing protein n=1 Tax=Marmoricola sp. RAF53 TaxID=3233059 RepID=UPI003F9CA761
MTSGTTDAAAVLASARRHRSEADAAEVRLFLDALAWAHAHTVEDASDCATWGDSPIPLAGEGAPLVSEFCVTELAAALGMSDHAGRALIASALEIAHRLPRIFHRVQTGTLQVWRARRIAERTLALSPEAALHVDRYLARTAHRIGLAATERLIDEAIATHMPDHARQLAEQAADQRHVRIDHQQVSFAGTSLFGGELDLVDAQDLDTRLSVDAADLKEWGCDLPLDVRRAMALGNLARGETPLPTAPANRARSEEPVVEQRSSSLSRRREEDRARATSRPITLYLHLDPRNPFGSLENRGPHLITREQIEQWLNAPGAQITIRPVLDLNQEVSTQAYEPTDRIREHVILRDRTCVFPYCTRRARACDLDHIEPYDPDGPKNQTRTSNLAALCRHHHRLKTHGGWRYQAERPGAYRWRSPLGYTYLRDQTGTRQLTPRPVDPPGIC